MSSTKTLSSLIETFCSNLSIRDAWFMFCNSKEERFQQIGIIEKLPVKYSYPFTEDIKTDIITGVKI